MRLRRLALVAVTVASLATPASAGTIVEEIEKTCAAQTTPAGIGQLNVTLVTAAVAKAGLAGFVAVDCHVVDHTGRVLATVSSLGTVQAAAAVGHRVIPFTGPLTLCVDATASWLDGRDDTFESECVS